MELKPESGGYAQGQVVRLYGSFKTNGSSAPSVIRDGKSACVSAVSRVSAGLYQVTFDAGFPIPERLVFERASVNSSATPTLVCKAAIVNGSYSQSARTVRIVVTTANALAVAASGTITCGANASAADGNSVTLGDGVNPAVTYEYDKSSNGVTTGNVSWAVGTTAASNATALAALIATNQPALTVVDDLAGGLTLTSKLPGTIGNVTITKSGSGAVSAVTGMSGGTQLAYSAVSDPDTAMRVNFELVGSISSSGTDAA